MIIPTLRLDLYVLAYDIESGTLSQLYVVAQSLVCGRGEYAVGPVALIEQTEMEHELAVESGAHHTVYLPHTY